MSNYRDYIIFIYEWIMDTFTYDIVNREVALALAGRILKTNFALLFSVHYRIKYLNIIHS